MLTVYDDRHYLITPPSLGVQLPQVNFAAVTDLPVLVTAARHTGGIVRVKGTFPWPRGVPLEVFQAIWPDAFATLNHGMEIGNESALSLARRLPIVAPYPIPKIARKFGVRPNYRESRVAVTCEHLSAARDENYLVIKRRGKEVPGDLIAPLLAELAEFGVSAETTPEAECEDLRSHIAGWFDNHASELQITRIAITNRDALFLVAAARYAMLSLELAKNRNYDSIHLIAEIESEPNFRPHWTSNR